MLDSGKRESRRNTDLLKHEGKGSIAGEGAAFFMVTGKSHPENYARFMGVNTFYKPETDEETLEFIQSFISSHGLALKDIDLLITGMNGDPEGDEVYRRIQKKLFKDTPSALL